MGCFDDEDDLYGEFELRDDLLSEVRVEQISRTFSRMLKKEDGLGAVVDIVVRLTAFDVGEEVRTSDQEEAEDEDEISEDEST